MPLKLMYTTNRSDVALIAEKAGVDRIFADMEYIGKDLRQGGMDSKQNHHTAEDVKNLSRVLTKAELLVRVNPIHEKTSMYVSSEEEINEVIKSGAEIIMLPYFKTLEEIERFLEYVGGRAKTMLLLETPEAADILDSIIKVRGIDEIHIGINDLSLGYGKKFMFELLCDGTVETLCMKLRHAGIPYGFGGIAAIGTGMLPAEAIIREHYRLGSSMAILSRSFCNTEKDLDYIRERFETGIRCIRSFEKEAAYHSEYFSENLKNIKECVRKITEPK